MEIDQKQLVTVNLKYGTAAQPLRTVAFAQLAAKALYLAGTPLTSDEIARDVGVLLSIERVDPVFVRRGLAYLRERADVTNERDVWTLQESTSKGIAESINESASRLASLLTRHFPSDLPREKLRPWFCEASARVFGRYGDEWVATLSRGTRIAVPHFTPLGELLVPVARTYGLEGRTGALKEGYLGFLGSSSSEDQIYLMSLAQAMFSARLVTAAVGADVLTLQEFRQATMVLDTNVLFAIALEDHHLGRSLNALGKALVEMGVKPVFIRPTQGEYEAVWKYKQESLISTIKEYQAEIVNAARDDFLATARGRGCETVEDFERFFESIQAIPSEFAGGLAIELWEDDVIQTSIDSGIADHRLEAQLAGLRRRLRPNARPKTGKALKHDAALLHVVESERQQGRNVWILSIDRSLAASSRERSGPHGLPAVLTADALIEILALNDGGPGVEADDFAPLLARIILNQCEPSRDAYTVDDLYLLTKINDAASELDPKDTRELVQIVTKARLEGKGADDTSLQLEVNRRFQQKVRTDEEVLGRAQERARRSEEALDVERKARLAAEEREVFARRERDRSAAKTRLIQQMLWRVPLAVALSAGAFLVAKSVLPPDDKYAFADYVLSAGAFILSGWSLVLKELQKYKSRDGTPQITKSP